MTLVEHAERELRLCGQWDEDQDFSRSIVEAVRAFTSYYGHSGGSHFVAVAMLTDLLNYKPLSPLTDDPDEWVDVAEYNPGVPLWQNKRRHDAFSYDGGKTYYTLEERDRLDGDMSLTPFHESKKVRQDE